MLWINGYLRGTVFFFLRKPPYQINYRQPSINHPSATGAKSFVLRTPGLCASSVGPGRSAGARLRGGLRGEASIFRSTPFWWCLKSNCWGKSPKISFLHSLLSKEIILIMALRETTTRSGLIIPMFFSSSNWYNWCNCWIKVSEMMAVCGALPRLSDLCQLNLRFYSLNQSNLMGLNILWEVYFLFVYSEQYCSWENHNSIIIAVKMKTPTIQIEINHTILLHQILRVLPLIFFANNDNHTTDTDSSHNADNAAIINGNFRIPKWRYCTI